MTRRTGNVIAGTSVVLALACGLMACVLTTQEGPSEPPRVLAPPPLPGASPIPNPETAEPSSSLEVGDAQPSSGDGGVVAEPAEIAASHILVMHRGSMRAPPEITRSKEEALERAKTVLARATAGDDFGVLAAEFSDDRGSKINGGKLGRFQRRMMVKPFADAAFALKPGELSGIIETPFGYHVILRTE